MLATLQQPLCIHTSFALIKQLSTHTHVVDQHSACVYRFRHTCAREYMCTYMYTCKHILVNKHAHTYAMKTLTPQNSHAPLNLAPYHVLPLYLLRSRALSKGSQLCGQLGQLLGHSDDGIALLLVPISGSSEQLGSVLCERGGRIR